MLLTNKQMTFFLHTHCMDLDIFREEKVKIQSSFSFFAIYLFVFTGQWQSNLGSWFLWYMYVCTNLEN